MDYSLMSEEDVPSPGIVLKKARAKTSAGGTLSNNVTESQGSALPNAIDYYGRSNAAQAKAEQLSSAPVDYSAMQAFAKQRGEQGNAAMLNALAAQFAGEQFEPVQTQLLKRAAAAQEPIKMAGGLITPEGGFLKDPEAERDKLIKMYSDQAARYAQIAQTAESSRDRILARQREQEMMANVRMLGLQIQQQGLVLRAENAAATRALQEQGARDRAEKDLSTRTETLANRAKDFTSLYAGVKDLNNALAPITAANKGIPGIGFGSHISLGPLDISGRFIGEEGRANRAMAQNVLNQLIRTDAGQAVSLQEGERQKLATMLGGNFSEEDFVNAWNKIIVPRVNETIANLGAGFTPEVKQRYRNQGGRIDFDKPIAPAQYPDKKGAAAGGTFDDPEKERRYQEWKKQNGG